MQKILIVEDEKTIRLGLSYLLNEEGYQTLTAANGEMALELINQESIDLMLLDLNLPDMHGFDVLKQVKDKHDIPTICLTADDMETSVVQGLDLGADDYITKPFRAKELASRINSVLRRNNKNFSNVIQVQNVRIDMTQAKVYKDEEDLMLTALEYKIFLQMALEPGKVFSRDKLLADIWDVDEAYVYDNTLTVYIKRIREKIEDEPNHPKIIVTVRGLGYKVVADHE